MFNDHKILFVLGLFILLNNGVLCFKFFRFYFFSCLSFLPLNMTIRTQAVYKCIYFPAASFIHLSPHFSVLTFSQNRWWLALATYLWWTKAHTLAGVYSAVGVENASEVCESVAGAGLGWISIHLRVCVCACARVSLCVSMCVWLCVRKACEGREKVREIERTYER